MDGAPGSGGAGLPLRWDAVTLDCSDPARLAAFWTALLGVGIRGRWEQYIGLEPMHPGQPRLVLQHTEDPRPPKNTVHLDLHVPSVAEMDGAVARALDLGARFVRRVEQAGATWCVLADPEGNVFCLVSDEA